MSLSPDSPSRRLISRWREPQMRRSDSFNGGSRAKRSVCCIACAPRSSGMDDVLTSYVLTSSVVVRRRSEAQQAAQEKETAEQWAAATHLLPREQIAAAAERNFNAATDMAWRRLHLRTRHERLQLAKESEECTFRPKCIAKHAHVQSRYQLSLPATTTTTKMSGPSRERPRPPKRVDGCRSTERNVFDRLSTKTTPSRQHLRANRDAPSSPHRAVMTADQLTRFVAHQVHDDAKRAVRRSVAALSSVLSDLIAPLTIIRIGHRCRVAPDRSVAVRWPPNSHRRSRRRCRFAHARSAHSFEVGRSPTWCDESANSDSGSSKRALDGASSWLATTPLSPNDDTRTAAACPRQVRRWLRTPPRRSKR